MRPILGRLAAHVRLMPEDDLIAEILREYGSAEAPGGLGLLAESGPCPLGVLVDDFNVLLGDSLLSVLR